jgi:acyl transferase domain-containing protein/NAD(P)-dependent dehydrogenase (short-subunit alcohol dehydrogenase family)/acyl carrier protein
MEQVMTEPHAIAQQAPIAVVGIGAMYPGSTTADGFWQDIVRARDLMTEVPDTHWLIEDYYDPDPAKPDKTYCSRGAFLPPVEFDPMEFGVPPAILRSTDSSQLLSLIVARDVLEDVFGGRPPKPVRDRTSVVLGFAGAQELISPLVSRLQRPIWANAMRESGVDEAAIEAICDRIAERFIPWDEASFPGLLGNVAAGRVANRLDLHGANLTTDAACASSLAALHTAVNQLLLGEADLAITGGVDANNDIFVYMSFSKTPALSRTEDCRPFSDSADGTMMGEGIGMVALKRLADAERDGNRIYAVLRGIGFSSDGRSRSIYAPRGDGQALAVRRCYDRAGYGPETVELVEAHGTGTRAGDQAEVEGLRAVFGGAPADGRHTTALGSVKSQIGHTKGAAGAAGLLKVVMALHEKVLPPTIKVDRPDPELKLADSPFYLNTAARPWVRDSSQPRRASVSAFGFGGTNYHASLEEYTGPSAAPARSRLRSARSELFLCSGETSASLAARCTAMNLEQGDFVARVFASHREFDPAAPVRLAVVADSADDLAAKLARAAASLRESEAPSLATPDGVYLCAAPPVTGDVAFLFPGQGSQYVGMGADLAMAHPRARGVWDGAAATRFDGLATHEVAFPPPAFSDDERQALEARLRATEWAQPALGLAGLAGFAVLEALRLRPRWLLGHSFGELAALCAAGSLTPPDLLRLARVRGEAMRDAASESPGGMSAVFASGSAVAALIERAGASAVIANYNSGEEVVVSGSHEALERIEDLCAREKITVRRLPVAAAFHSPAVAGAASRFADALAEVEVRPPTAEVLANADAQPYPHDPDAIRQRLARQLAEPGAVLSELAGRVLAGETHLAVSIDRKGRDGVVSLNHALARLATAGVPLHLDPLWETYQPPPARPLKRPAATVTLTGTNYGKLYPPKRARDADGRQRPAASPRDGATAPAQAPLVGGAPALFPPAGAVPAGVPQPPADARPNVAGPPRLDVLPGPVPDASWLQAYDAIQRRVAETHIAVTRAMADMHAAFLASMTSSPSLGAVTGSPVLEVPNGHDGYGPPAAPPGQSAAESPTAPAPPPGEELAGPAVDLAGLLLSVVADKTGYQQDMLAMDMNLEADLGIDSIKRVEILAAMRDAVPELPDVDPAAMASIRSLGDVVAGLKGAVGETAVREVERADPDLSPPAEPPSPGKPDATTGVERLAPRMAPRPALGLALAGLCEARRVAVTDDGGGVATHVAEGLVRAGLAAEVVAEVPDDADAVVYLGGLRPVRGADEAIAVNREAFHLARAIAPRFARTGGVFVTVQDTGGDFGLAGADEVRAWLGGVVALARTARQEWPAATVKAIDCQRGGRSPSELAEAIVAELLTGGESPDIGLGADGFRRRPELHAQPAEAGELPLSEGAVVVATGGARGVTAACLEELARECRPRLVLLGRTTLSEEPPCCAGAEDEIEVTQALIADARSAGHSPSPAEVRAAARSVLAAREARHALRALERAGAEVSYVAVDVRDAEAVARALAEVRARFGPIQGLVHGAGVLADKLIEEKTDEQFDVVFDTKVGGLRAVLAATQQDQLTYLCLFSSVVAQTGNRGQCDYAMANEILNQVASAEQTRRGTGCVVRAIGWGSWDGGMVTPPLRQHFTSRGVPLLRIADGRRAFAAESRSRGDVIAIVGSAGTAEALAGATRFQTALGLRVSARSHPYLADHAIGGVPVLPIVLAAEWFHRALDDVSRDRLPVLRSLKVLSGLRFAPGLPETLLHLTRRFEGGAWRLAMGSLDGQLAYSAAADFAPGPPDVAVPVAPSGRLVGGELYDGFVLFHGAAFQALRSLEEADGRGMCADVVGLTELGWPDEPWRTDPAALDAMLQLGAKWSEREVGGPTLPMGFQALRLSRGGPLRGPMRATVRTRELHHSRAVCDIALAGTDGTMLATLSGVDYLLRPDRAPGTSQRGEPV